MGGLLLIYGKMFVYMKLQPDKLPKPGTESPKKLRGVSVFPLELDTESPILSALPFRKTEGIPKLEYSETFYLRKFKSMCLENINLDNSCTVILGMLDMTLSPLGISTDHCCRQISSQSDLSRSENKKTEQIDNP